MSENITITKVSYSRQRDRKVLHSCLNNWFSDPKSLNLTDPRMRYPFRFEKWVKLSYSEGDKETWILRVDEWIVAYLSLSFVSEENRGAFISFVCGSGTQRKRVCSKTHASS